MADCVHIAEQVGERVWRERPWPTGWESWTPPADWVTPDLPEGWDG